MSRHLFFAGVIPAGGPRQAEPEPRASRRVSMDVRRLEAVHRLDAPLSCRCAWCDRWRGADDLIRAAKGAQVSHSLCADCERVYFGEGYTTARQGRPPTGPATTEAGASSCDTSDGRKVTP